MKRTSFTIKQLETMSDDEILRILVSDRQTGCTNVYAPLYQRLQKIHNNLSKKIEEKK